MASSDVSGQHSVQVQHSCDGSGGGPIRCVLVRFIGFGRAVATRQAFQSKKSAQRLNSLQLLAVPRPSELAHDDLLSGTVQGAGSDLQPAFTVEAAAHSDLVGLQIADTSRDDSNPVAAWLQTGENEKDQPAVQLLPDPLHSKRFANSDSRLTPS